jgi:hypothetical protein
LGLLPFRRTRPRPSHHHHSCTFRTHIASLLRCLFDSPLRRHGNSACAPLKWRFSTNTVFRVLSTRNWGTYSWRHAQHSSRPSCRSGWCQTLLPLSPSVYRNSDAVSQPGLRRTCPNGSRAKSQDRGCTSRPIRPGEK